MNLSWLALERMKGLFEVVRILTHDFVNPMYITLSANLKTPLQIPPDFGWNFEQSCPSECKKSAEQSLWLLDSVLGFIIGW